MAFRHFSFDLFYGFDWVEHDTRAGKSKLFRGTKGAFTFGLLLCAQIRTGFLRCLRSGRDVLGLFLFESLFYRLPCKMIALVMGFTWT